MFGKRMSKSTRLLFMAGFLFIFLSAAHAQGSSDQDSLVRLIDAATAKLVEKGNTSYRKVIGNARFLHNDTYLLCDSAMWNVNTNVIEAEGHVQIIRQDTYLLGDKLTYFADDNLAQFRGGEVILYNKKGDRLKTRYLDYNTKDSLATFYHGGVLRSKDGDIIEGDNGSYQAGAEVFTFDGNVNMFSDSLFVRSQSAEYYSQTDMAYFGEKTVAFKERDTLYTDKGDYNGKNNTLIIRNNNYITTKDQEIWAHLAYYFRESGNAELFGDVQIRDNSQSTILLGEIGVYKQDPTRAFLTDHAAAAMYSEEKQGVDSLTGAPIYKRDTAFLKGDTLYMRVLPKYEIDAGTISQAEERRLLAEMDPMLEIDRVNRAFFEAYYRNKELLDNPQYQQMKTLSNEGNGETTGEESDEGEVQPPLEGEERSELRNQSDSLITTTDSLSTPTNSADSLYNGADTLNFSTDSLSSGADPLITGADSLNTQKDLLGGEVQNLTQGFDTLKSGDETSPSVAEDEGDGGEAGAVTEDDEEFDNLPKSPADSLSSGDDSLITPTDSLSTPTNSADSLYNGADTLNFSTDSLGNGADTLNFSTDSLGSSVDSLSLVPRDSTQITLINIHHNVLLYRSDLRGACDSLVYTTLDSIARFYTNPIMWTDEKTQLTADTMNLSIRNNTIYKANFIENAFIISQEDSIHFDQIKSPEMAAFFADDELYRFDAMGGATVLVFLKERDSVVTLMNYKECKLLTARLKDNEITRVKYIEQLTSNVTPTYQMPEEEMRLKGFTWRIEEMPTSRYEITEAKINPSQRGSLSRYSFPNYPQTKIYFPEDYSAIIKLKREIDENIARAIEEENNPKEKPQTPLSEQDDEYERIAREGSGEDSGEIEEVQEEIKEEIKEEQPKPQPQNRGGENRSKQSGNANPVTNNTAPVSSDNDINIQRAPLPLNDKKLLDFEPLQR